jgi:hypothetical protein
MSFREAMTQLAGFPEVGVGVRLLVCLVVCLFGLLFGCLVVCSFVWLFVPRFGFTDLIKS